MISNLILTRNLHFHCIKIYDTTNKNSKASTDDTYLSNGSRCCQNTNSNETFEHIKISLRHSGRTLFDFSIFGLFKVTIFIFSSFLNFNILFSAMTSNTTSTWFIISRISLKICTSSVTYLTISSLCWTTLGCASKS